MKPRALFLAIMAIVSPASTVRADAPAYTCGSGDRRASARDVALDTAEWRELQRAALHYCERASGEERRDCRYVVQLVKHTPCAFELSEATASTPASVAFGTLPDSPEWSWHAQLERVGGKWRVRRIYLDDLERP